MSIEITNASLMRCCLNWWADKASEGWFGTHTREASFLVQECKQDQEDGLKTPVPWLALCDLVEECGEKPALRGVTKGHFNLTHPPSSRKK